MTAAIAPREYDGIELSSEAFWAKSVRERDESFAVLRRERPISWQPPAYGSLMPDADDAGYWAVVRHADIVEISQNSDVFVSRYGVMFDMLPPVFMTLA